MKEQFENLKNECLTCTKCQLCTTRKNVVFGVGNINSEIMFIGEGPGENEDIQGEPFVGLAGKLLDKMLYAINLDRNKNIYIANMVKCRPPNNRDPKQEEQLACMPYLNTQVKLISPKIIVCLGRIAAQKIMYPEFKVTKEHGTWHYNKDNNILMMGMFHPAAVLRYPENKPTAFKDFLTLRDKIKELNLDTYKDLPIEEPPVQ